MKVDGFSTDYSAVRSERREEGEDNGSIAMRSDMGSLLGDLPSYDPHNFSQLRPADPSSQSSKSRPVTYHPTHSRTLPPPDQVISTESRNILLRHFYQKSEEKLRPKRAASDYITPEHSCKQPKGASADSSP